MHKIVDFDEIDNPSCTMLPVGTRGIQGGDCAAARADWTDRICSGDNSDTGLTEVKLSKELRSF